MSTMLVFGSSYKNGNNCPNFFGGNELFVGSVIIYQKFVCEDIAPLRDDNGLW
jgi:hypothetical protein